MDEKKKDYFVAYLDVMGFTDIVTSEKNEKIDLYVHALEEEILKLLEEKFTSIKFFTISDSIVLLSEYDRSTEPSKKNSLRVLLEIVQEVQVILALKNIWLRGAISFGEVWFEKGRNILIGKGYINAYTLEREAIYFRVVLDPKIVLELKTSGMGMRVMYNQGKDYKYDVRKKLIYGDLPTDKYLDSYKFIQEDGIFVNYGYEFVKRINDNNWGDFFATLKTNLYSDQKTYSRYLWLKKYFTSCFLEASGLCSSVSFPSRQPFIHNCYSQMAAI